MRARTAIWFTSAVGALLLMSVLAIAHRFWMSALEILSAGVVGAMLAYLLLLTVRRLRPTVPAAGVLPGGLERPAGGLRDQRIRPAELPPPPGLLIGRDDELDKMLRHLENRTGNRHGPQVIMLHGELGVGRNALAISLAHRVADDYPDGQLMLSPEDRASGSVEEQLEMFVRALKGPRENVDDNDLRRWYRDRTLRQRVLVILTDVRNIDRVAPLLPAGPRCLTILTSTERLPDPPGDGPPPLRQAVLPLGDRAVRELLDQLVGGGRVGREPEPAAAIAAATAGYPLAALIAGAALAVRRNWTLASAVERMAAVPPDPVDQTAAGPAESAVPFSGVLDLAAALLTSAERRALGLLGLFEASRVEPWMLATALRAASPDDDAPGAAEAGRLLDRLARARFIERRLDNDLGPLSYSVPSYVRQYAAHRFTGDLPAPVREGVAAAVAARRQQRAERRTEDSLRNSVYRHLDEGRLDEALDTARESLALSRLDRASLEDSGGLLAIEESLELVALGEVLAELGWLDAAIDCVDRVWKRKPLSSMASVRALRLAGDLRRRLHQGTEAGELLASCQAEIGSLAPAGEEADQATPTDAEVERIRLLRELTALQALRHDLELGRAYAAQATDRCRAAGGRELPGVLLAEAMLERVCGDRDRSAALLAEAERLTTDRDDRDGQPDRLRQSWIRQQRALLLLDAGDDDQSREFSAAALEGFTALRHSYGAANAMLALGRAHLAQQRLQHAIPLLEQCHGTLRRCGDRWLLADAATALAEAYHLDGRNRNARLLLVAAQQAFAGFGDERSVRRADHLLYRVESAPPDRAADHPRPAELGRSRPIEGDRGRTDAAGPGGPGWRSILATGRAGR
ncbi:hypothetical protein ACFFWC_05070 [Plantactinospora siamensis]|uniref:Uncharacterized protein n=1 Tax=Plantactinospora siamensis TaxID=555372 RepID=A0ABV6NTF6_9ACTN